MKVDRARFLLLTTALSAATAVGVMATGCSVTSTNTTDGGTLPSTEDASTIDSSTIDSGSYDSGDGGACLGDDGPAPTCDAASVGACATACAHYLPNYKNAVGRAIIACIIALPTCEGAATEISACVQSALGQACPDTSASTYCSPMVTSCNASADGGADAGFTGLAQTECQDLATGLNATGRASFTSCITEGTAGYCTANTTTCFDLLE